MLLILEYVLHKANEEVNAVNTLVLIKDIISVHFKVCVSL